MVESLKVLYWWKNSDEIKSRVKLLEKEIECCIQKLEKDDNILRNDIKTYLTVDLKQPSEVKEPQSYKPTSIEKDKTIKLARNTLKYLSKIVDTSENNDMEIEIGDSTRIYQNKKIIKIHIGRQENSVRNIVSTCAGGFYRKMVYDCWDKKYT
eukprot:UN03574